MNGEVDVKGTIQVPNLSEEHEIKDVDVSYMQYLLLKKLAYHLLGPNVCAQTPGGRSRRECKSLVWWEGSWPSGAFTFVMTLGLCKTH